MSRNKPSKVVVAAVFASSLMLAASASEPADSHLARIQARGKLVVISFPEQGNPFFSVEMSRSHLPVSAPTRYRGIDSEILVRIARELGVALEYRVPTKFSMNELFVSLLTGEADIATGAVTITEHRRQRVDFSRGYYSFQPVVIVSIDSPIQEYADLLGKQAAASRGSSLEEHLRQAGFDQLILTDFAIGTVSTVEKGDADFGLEDEEISVALAKQFPGVRVAFSFPVEDSYGLAVPKGSDLVDLVDLVINEMQRSGELTALIDRHMNSKVQ